MATYNSDVEGTWTMQMGILVRASSPPDDFGFAAAATECDLAATLIINAPCAGCGSLTGAFLSGQLRPSMVAPVTACIPYTISGPGGTGNPQVINNFDGTITIAYRFQVTLVPVRVADTNIRLEVAALRDCTTPTNFDNLILSTTTGMFRTIPGTPLISTNPATDFFKHATPDWRGCGVRA